MRRVAQSPCRFISVATPSHHDLFPARCGRGCPARVLRGSPRAEGGHGTVQGPQGGRGAGSARGELDPRRLRGGGTQAPGCSSPRHRAATTGVWPWWSPRRAARVAGLSLTSVEATAGPRGEDGAFPRGPCCSDLCRWGGGDGDRVGPACVLRAPLPRGSLGDTGRTGPWRPHHWPLPLAALRGGSWGRHGADAPCCGWCHIRPRSEPRGGVCGRRLRGLGM